MRIILGIIVIVVIVAGLGFAGVEPFQTLKGDVATIIHNIGHDTKTLVSKPKGIYHCSSDVSSTINFLSDFDLTVSSGAINVVAYNYAFSKDYIILTELTSGAISTYTFMYIKEQDIFIFDGIKYTR